MNADEEALVVLARGFDFKSRQLEDLYKIQIKRSMKSNVWLWIVIAVAVAIILLTVCIVCTMNIRANKMKLR